ncbi:MAG: TIGR03435 family protein [Terracidiphilus sp.]
MTPRFDVAAIHVHESQPHEHNSIWSSPFDGNFNAENISIITLIDWAYEIPDTRILGAPGWAHSTMFNIEAKADPSVDQQMHNLASDTGRKQKERMVQTLLVERFQFAMHFETRELPIYSLVVAKGGPKLGAAQKSGSSVNTGSGRIEVQMSNSVAVLANELSKVAGREVVDKTGVSGRYDLELHWTPDDRAAEPKLVNGAPTDSGPSLFTALEEQLGLKLEPAKGPVEVLVIDHIEMPSPN